MSEKFRKNNIAQSVFEKNYAQIPESKQEILNQKYNCGICLEIIKYEIPFLCYECQKIFHHSCLKHWDERQNQLNKILSCPNCRNELSIENWKVLRNYDEMRTKDALILNQLEQNFNSIEYIDKLMSFFRLILNKLNNIHTKIESQKNFQLNNLIEELRYNIINPSIDEISKVIIDELDILDEYITNKKNIIQGKNKNEINLKYLAKEKGYEYIFGEKFVENNINNINLIINGKNSPLVPRYDLEEGENTVTICIKNTLTNLSYMFFQCDNLFNIDELKNLNTENVSDFSCMFESTEISNIKALENWETSSAETFHSMFFCCYSLTNLKPLKNWNVSRCKDFSEMFCHCRMSKINPLENWNVSNGTNFNRIFANNWLLSEIKSLKFGMSQMPEI